MAGTFKFELVSPERILISADVEQVIVPGMEGQFTVFAGHAPVISTLRPGILDAQIEGGRRRVFVRGGFAEVEPDRVTVLAQHLLDLDNLDAGHLAQELQSAEQMLADAKDDAARMVSGEAVEQLKALRA
jgi:F-type H+-transporting ATPase subunit epsilon